MTTASSTKENGSFTENGKNVNKWFDEASRASIDVYSKQLNSISEFYSNYFNSFFERSKNLWNPVKLYTDLFSSSRDGNKSAFMTFGTSDTKDSLQNIWMTTMEKVLKQMTDHNQTFLAQLSERMENGNFDWTAFNTKYTKNSEDLLQSIKRMLNSVVESSNKQMESAIETNKKLQEDLTRELTYFTKQNQQFWSDVASSSTKQQDKEHSFDGEKKAVRTQEKVRV